MTDRRLILCPNASALAATAAERFVSAVVSVEGRRLITVALSGGSTPLRLYEQLTSSIYRDAIPWSRLVLFWSDERFVPFTDPDSTYGAARSALLDRVPVPASQVHPVQPDCSSAGAAAEAYEELLRQTVPPGLGGIPRFDLVLLGMGPDGHTASLFPGYPQVEEQHRLVVAVADAPKPPPVRVTFTLPLINAAASVLVLATGADKADALRNVVLTDPGVAVPAGRVQPVHGDVTWVVDESAAAELPDQAAGWRIERGR